MPQRYLYTKESFKIASVMCPHLLLSIGELCICSMDIKDCFSYRTTQPLHYINRDIDEADLEPDVEESDLVYKERLRRKAKKNKYIILHTSKTGFAVGGVECKFIWEICYEQKGKHKCFNINNPTENPEKCLTDTITKMIKFCKQKEHKYIYDDAEQEQSFIKLLKAK